jgi:hypothetical protein
MTLSALSIQVHAPTTSNGVAFRFKVSRSSNDPKRAFGAVETIPHPSSPAHIFAKTDFFDVDVQVVWLDALAIAHHYGVLLIEIDDPEKLFPEKNPS